jgi:uncharacterized membrane protein
MQSSVFNVVICVVGIALWIVTFLIVIIGSQLPGFLGSILSLLATLVWIVFSIGLLIAWIMCLIKAFQGTYFKLPIIGNFAEKFSAK